MLDVPYVTQGEDDVGCVPACVKMIIEYYVHLYPDLPNPSIEDLKKAMHYEMDGTPLSGITDVNPILKGNQHQLEFSWNEFASFGDIKGELDNKRPVIAWIKQSRDWGISHSIVVKGKSENDLRVIVNDPDSEEIQEVETTTFMSAWENSDRVLIRAQVATRDIQRRIGDYTA